MSFMAFSLMGNLPRIFGERCGISHTGRFLSLRRRPCGQSGRMEARMLTRAVLLCLAALALTPSVGLAQSTSPNGVRTLDPPGAIKAEGTWSLGVRAGDFVFVAGMQGVDPATNTLVKDPQARVLRAFLNLKLIAKSEGASLQDCVRLTVYVSDLHRYAPMVDKAQAELWGKPPYPPRTMIEVQRLFDDDIVEIDSVFYAPAKK
jgi:2-iminobutanoate/2-iminopropanoate deaminase